MGDLFLLPCGSGGRGEVFDAERHGRNHGPARVLTSPMRKRVHFLENMHSIARRARKGRSTKGRELVSIESHILSKGQPPGRYTLACASGS